MFSVFVKDVQVHLPLELGVQEGEVLREGVLLAAARLQRFHVVVADVVPPLY